MHNVRVSLSVTPHHLIRNLFYRMCQYEKTSDGLSHCFQPISVQDGKLHSNSNYVNNAYELHNILYFIIMILYTSTKHSMIMIIIIIFYLLYILIHLILPIILYPIFIYYSHCLIHSLCELHMLYFTQKHINMQYSHNK